MQFGFACRLLLVWFGRDAEFVAASSVVERCSLPSWGRVAEVGASSPGATQRHRRSGRFVRRKRLVEEKLRSPATFGIRLISISCVDQALLDAICCWPFTCSIVIEVRFADLVFGVVYTIRFGTA
jgi:hypothetical protein